MVEAHLEVAQKHLTWAGISPQAQSMVRFMAVLAEQVLVSLPPVRSDSWSDSTSLARTSSYLG